MTTKQELITENEALKKQIEELKEELEKLQERYKERDEEARLFLKQDIEAIKAYVEKLKVEADLVIDFQQMNVDSRGPLVDRIGYLYYNTYLHERGDFDKDLDKDNVLSNIEHNKKEIQDLLDELDEKEKEWWKLDNEWCRITHKIMWLQTYID